MKCLFRKDVLMNKRKHKRQLVDYIDFSDLCLSEDTEKICKHGKIIDASVSGFLIEIHRDNLSRHQDRQNLSLDHLVGEYVNIFLPQMNLDLEGKIHRCQHKGQGTFQLGIKFSSDIPEYWRECLMDLLPYPGEFEEH